MLNFSLDEETADWKAGCGKTACPVWREGRCRKWHRPYPYMIAPAFKPCATPNPRAGSRLGNWHSPILGNDEP